MTAPVFALLLVLLAASTTYAQNGNEKEVKPDDPLAMPLPDGISSAIRFTIGSDFNTAEEQAALIGNPLLAQIATEKPLHRFDFIVREVASATGKPRLGQLRIVFLFNDMASFSRWYARSETKTMITQLRELGSRNLGMKFENIRTPTSALVME